MNALTKTLPIFSALALMVGSASTATIVPTSYAIATGAGVLDPNMGTTWGDVGGNQLNDNVTNTATGSNNVGWDYNSGTDRPLVTFDLGDVYDVSTIQIYSRTSNGTITSIDISTSLDDSTYSGVTNYAYSAPAGTINVAAEANARYIRFTPYSSDWSMISEVDFDGTLVPEPGSLALLGLGGLLIGARRRRG